MCDLFGLFRLISSTGTDPGLASLEFCTNRNLWFPGLIEEEGHLMKLRSCTEALSSRLTFGGISFLVLVFFAGDLHAQWGVYKPRRIQQKTLQPSVKPAAKKVDPRAQVRQPKSAISRQQTENRNGRRGRTRLAGPGVYRGGRGIQPYQPANPFFDSRMPSASANPAANQPKQVRANSRVAVSKKPQNRPVRIVNPFFKADNNPKLIPPVDVNQLTEQWLPSMPATVAKDESGPKKVGKSRTLAVNVIKLARTLAIKAAPFKQSLPEEYQRFPLQ